MTQLPWQPYLVCMAQDVQLLTTGEVARKLGVSDETIRRWCAAGKIRAIPLPSGRWKIREDVVDDLLAQGAPIEAAA